MATNATGTPTSPDNIPTFLTSADAPSGKGFNAAMAAIQTALSARVNNPSGIASGEVPVWNGTTWVRSSVTKINTSNVTSRDAVTVNMSGPLSTTNSVATTVTNWTTTTSNGTNGAFTVGPSAVTINLNGWYLITSTLNFAGGAGTARLGIVLVNGAEVARGFQLPSFANVTTAAIAFISATQTVALQGFQDSGGSLNITGGSMGIVQVAV